MTQKDILKPSNIRESIWKIIDTDIAMKRDLSRNLINTRALAKYIIEKNKLDVSLDAVISAIRRYQVEPERTVDAKTVYSYLKQAKISTVTKMASLTLKKTETVHEKISMILTKTDYPAGEILRVIEAAKVFKLIFDQKNYQKMIDLFGKGNIVGFDQRLGVLEIIYPITLEKTPGIFSVISGELAENEISISDAIICSNEHILVIEEKNLLKAFDIIYNICN